MRNGVAAGHIGTGDEHAVGIATVHAAELDQLCLQVPIPLPLPGVQFSALVRAETRPMQAHRVVIPLTSVSASDSVPSGVGIGSAADGTGNFLTTQRIEATDPQLESWGLRVDKMYFRLSGLGVSFREDPCGY